VTVDVLVKYKRQEKDENVKQMKISNYELVKLAIPLWYAQVIWAKELLIRSFKLEKAEDILRPENRGIHQIQGTVWFVRTHGIGVDIFKSPTVGGVDFDFDKPNPDSWRLRIFIEQQVNDGNLQYSLYRELIDDEDLLIKTIDLVLREKSYDDIINNNHLH